MLEEIALKDSYFVERKLNPNVNSYSVIIYSALGIPPLDVYGDVRHCQYGGVCGALAGDDFGTGDADSTVAAAVFRGGEAGLCGAGQV